MARKSITLRQERAPIETEIRRLADLANDEKHEWSSEDEARWVQVNADYDRLTKRIQLAERAEEIELEGATRSALRTADDDDGEGDTGRAVRSTEAPRNEETRALAIQAWARAGAGLELSDEHVRAARSFGINVGAKEIELDVRRDYRRLRREIFAAKALETRAPMATTAGSGGETIPEGFVPEWEFALLEFGGAREVSRVIRTASGNDLPWPTTDDTSNKGELLAESTGAAEQHVATGALVLNAYKYSSKIILVPWELLEDSAFNLASEIGRLAGERIARITEEHFTKGTGTGQPKGFMVAGAIGKTTAANNAITSDELLDFYHSVGRAYRRNGTFQFNDATVLVIRKLKDSGTPGQYLWQPGLQAGEPDRLLGKPVVTNDEIATIASQALVGAFGDFSRYIIRDVASVRLRRLDERYAEKDQVGFIAFSRHDGDLLNAGTGPIKTLKMAT